MRKPILFTLAVAILALPIAMEAQESEITASAYIPTVFNISGDVDLDFEEIDQNSTENRAATLGLFSIEHNQEVAVEVEAGDLTHADGDAISPVWECVINTDDNPENAEGRQTACANGSAQTAAWTSGRVTSYLHLDGVIDGTALGTHALGTYTGTITVRAVSND